MRVLVTGASGFIGSALVRALLREGHQVICASRHPPHPAAASAGCEGLAVDFSQVPTIDWWSSRLARIDAVVNAVGILRERSGETFAAVHAQAPIALFRACAAVGVPLVVQISALGADDAAASRYHLTKKAADDALRALPLRFAIIQPSLVYGAGGANATLFNAMAALPVLALPLAGVMQVQPVHLDDVVAGVLALLHSPPQDRPTIACVGPQPLSLADFLRQLRSLQGRPGRLHVLALPVGLFNWVAGIAAHVPSSALDRETAGMLLRGNVAPSEPFARLLGRLPRPVARFLDATETQPGAHS